MSANLTVKPVSRMDTLPFIMGIHYAKRIPSISYSYGLFDNGELIGICTYGTPASSTLRIGVCGESFSPHVIELNRLCLKYNRKNEASFLVSSTLKLLPKPKIIVSFADTEQNHTGVVYQACNFLYTGLSAKRTNWCIKGRENLHGQTIADEFRGCENRSKAMRDKYGDDFYLKPRSRKHRYIYVIGNRKFKKDAVGSLNYKTTDYPKKNPAFDSGVNA
jgi:hypothetical protein